MKKPKYGALFIIFLLIFVGCSGENNNKNNKNNEIGTIKWKFDTHTSLYASPSIGPDGTIYLSIPLAPGMLYAINPNGTIKWTANSPNLSTQSAPTVSDDGTIYVGAQAYDSNGSLKWSYPTGKITYSSPAISRSGVIYVGSNDKFLYAINLDGTLKWRFLTSAEIDSSPAIGTDGTIYILSRNAFYAINPNGTQKWKIDIGYYASEILRSSPAIDSDGTIYVCNCAINPDGTIKWGTFGLTYCSPIIGNDSIYIGDDTGNLYSYDKKTGIIKWSFSTYEMIRCTAAIGADGTIYFGSSGFYALDSNGSLKWKIDSVYCDTPIVVSLSGIIYFGHRNSPYLYAINSSSYGLQLSSSWPMFKKDAQLKSSTE